MNPVEEGNPEGDQKIRISLPGCFQLTRELLSGGHKSFQRHRNLFGGTRSDDAGWLQLRVIAPI